MYNKVYKNYQVNMGKPYQMCQLAKIIKANSGEESEIEDEINKESAVEKGPTAEEIIEQAYKEAELIKKEAELEVQRMLEQTEADMNKRAEEMLMNSYNEGYQNGEQEAIKKCEDLIHEAEFIREHAKTEYNEVLKGIENDAVNLIIDIARKVISAELTQNRDCILGMVKEAFDNCSNNEEIVLKVSPDDFDFVNSSEELLLSKLEGVEKLCIKKDFSLGKGSCVLDTKFGTVDGSWETKFEKIRSEFNRLMSTH